MDLTRAIIRRLANLSLQDYKWRSDYFKKSEADRRVEESLARMIGDDPSYFRPMDASDSKIGPLVRITCSFLLCTYPSKHSLFLNTVSNHFFLKKLDYI